MSSSDALGQFAGNEIDEASETPTGEFAGAILDDEPTVVPESVNINPIPLAVQSGQTAVGVAPQTVNLFAGEQLAENPVVKREEHAQTEQSEDSPKQTEKPRKAGVAKRKKKEIEGDAERKEFLASITAESAAHNASRGTLFTDDADMSPTVTQPDRISEQDKRSKRKAKKEKTGKLGDAASKLGRISFGLFAGVVIGGALGLWGLAVFGPWAVTDTGIVAKDIGAPINNLPAGTNITMTKVGTVAPTGANKFIPIILSTSKAEVTSQYLQNDRVVGYNVLCISGDCTTGLTFTVPVEAILGKG